MESIYIEIKTVFLVLCFTQLLIASSNAGSCYKIRTERNLCKSLYAENLSRQNCCQLGGFYVERDLSSSDRFRGMIGGIRGCEIACPIETPCDQIRCPEDRSCKSSEQKGPHCVCDVTCTYEDRYSEPVCGSDGEIYGSLCAMRRQRCHLGIYLMPVQCSLNAYQCSDRLCPGSRQYCALDEVGRPVCYRHSFFGCPSQAIYEKTCSIDNVTYSNPCEINRVSAERSQKVQIAYEGECKASASCATMQCPQGMICMSHHSSGIPVCRYDCTPENVDMCESKEKLCTSDGSTYNNLCQFRQRLCSTRIFRQIMHLGSCRGHSGS